VNWFGVYDGQHLTKELSMANLDLINFLADSANDLIMQAEKTTPAMAKVFLDEAEELILLGAKLNERRLMMTDMVKEAA
jgi:hypothetical protein